MNTNCIQPLHPQSILDLLGDKEIEVVCLAETDSTNNEVKRRIAAGQTGKLLLMAERQSAGRGRAGKSFYSLLDGSIYLTFAEPAGEIVDPGKVTIAAAVAVAEAVEELTGNRLGIKWVNDLYYVGKKVCGILCESVCRDQESYILIGIGINIGRFGIPKELESIASGIDLGGSSRNALIAAIVNNYNNLKQIPFMDVLSSYRARSFLTGKTVAFERDGNQIKAAVLEIDDGGRLIVITEDGCELALCSGEVSISVKN